MALTESKVQASITLNQTANAVEVRWDNIIKRDDEIISRVPHRKAYSQDQKEELLAEVEGAQIIVQSMGW